MTNALGTTLLAWYMKNRRDLPWRKTRDPYKIWVSEIMLQQTQVQTVLGYYDRWMRKFPTVKALARASQEQVLKAWQGLGYYRRAKNLHNAAKEIAAKHNGVFPKTLEEIRALPGIGPYTAGAIVSIAFNKPVCALDVNVLRVGCRVLGLQEDPAKAWVREAVANEAQRWIPKQKARWFNQALMELGALICVPSAPRCSLCPIREFCLAYQKGLQKKIPPRQISEKRIKISVVAGILRDPKGRVLIQKRPQDGLMGNLWEFPGGKVEPRESLEQALSREWQEELGVLVKPLRCVMNIAHAYTKFDVDLHVLECSLASGCPKALWAQEIRWVPVARLDDYAYPSANVKIVRWLKSKKSLEKAIASR